MKRFVLRTSVVGLAASLGALPLAAQQAKPTVFDVSPYAGYMMFGKMIEGPIGTSVSSGSGPVYGAQMSLTMAKNVALYGNVGYSSTDLKIGLPIIGGLDVGSSKALLYDGGVELKIPMQAASMVTPFVQGGIGAIKYEVSSGFLDANATNVLPRNKSLKKTFPNSLNILTRHTSTYCGILAAILKTWPMPGS